MGIDVINELLRSDFGCSGVKVGPGVGFFENQRRVQEQHGTQRRELILRVKNVTIDQPIKEESAVERREVRKLPVLLPRGTTCQTLPNIRLAPTSVGNSLCRKGVAGC